MFKKLVTCQVLLVIKHDEDVFAPEDIPNCNMGRCCSNGKTFCNWMIEDEMVYSNAQLLKEVAPATGQTFIN